MADAFGQHYAQPVPAGAAAAAAGHPQPDVQLRLDEFMQADPMAASGAPQSVMAVLIEGAQTGGTSYPWLMVKKVVRAQFRGTMDELVRATGTGPPQDGETFQQRYERVLAQLDEFAGPPFTFQRMCELLIHPQRYYQNTSKFFQAFSKLVIGISSGAPTELRSAAAAAGGGGALPSHLGALHPALAPMDLSDNQLLATGAEPPPWAHSPIGGPVPMDSDALATRTAIAPAAALRAGMAAAAVAGAAGGGGGGGGEAMHLSSFRLADDTDRLHGGGDDDGDD